MLIRYTNFKFAVCNNVWDKRIIIKMIGFDRGRIEVI